MNFSEYRKLSIKTMSITGSKITDSAHMTLGLNTEIIGELPSSVEKSDLVNFKEEIGDTLWYLANFCNIWEIDPELNEEITTDKNDKSFGIVKLDPKDIKQLLLIFQIGRIIADLQDIDKKELAYGKKGNIETRKELISKVYSYVFYYCFCLGLDIDEIMENNIEKLSARYPNLIFSAENAITRDLDNERTILEKVYEKINSPETEESEF